jgi:AcrR family transcriptional regulator
VPERKTLVPNAGRGRLDETDAKRRGTGRTRRGRQTRQQLVDGARTVFERDGFVHARIADICDAAGTSHGSFYTYFVSKEQIFNEVVDSVEVDLLTIDPAPADADPVERIRVANRHYLETYRSNAKIMQVIHQVATIDDEVRKTRAQRQADFARAIERRTSVLQQAGLADAGVDLAYASQALGGMVAYFAELMFNSEHDYDYDLETAVEQLTRIWVNALGIRVQE